MLDIVARQYSEGCKTPLATRVKGASKEAEDGARGVCEVVKPRGISNNGRMGGVEAAVGVEVVGTFGDGEGDDADSGVDEICEDGAGVGRREIIENGGNDLRSRGRGGWGRGVLKEGVVALLVVEGRVEGEFGGEGTGGDDAKVE